MKYALIKSGTVQNIIEADADSIALITPDFDHIEPIDTLHEQCIPVSPGWLWDGEFHDHNPAPAAPAAPRRITVGAFFDRFGAHKWPILADTNAVVQALIKDCSVRAWINLDDPQLDGGLAMLVDAGHAIDPAAILSAPVQSSESP
jgi:hypothetical protein